MGNRTPNSKEEYKGTEFCECSFILALILRDQSGTPASFCPLLKCEHTPGVHPIYCAARLTPATRLTSASEMTSISVIP